MISLLSFEEEGSPNICQGDAHISIVTSSNSSLHAMLYYASHSCVWNLTVTSMLVSCSSFWSNDSCSEVPERCF